MEWYVVLFSNAKRHEQRVEHVDGVLHGLAVDHNQGKVNVHLDVVVDSTSLPSPTASRSVSPTASVTSSATGSGTSNSSNGDVVAHGGHFNVGHALDRPLALSPSTAVSTSPRVSGKGKESGTSSSSAAPRQTSGATSSATASSTPPRPRLRPQNPTSAPRRPPRLDVVINSVQLGATDRERDVAMDGVIVEREGGGMPWSTVEVVARRDIRAHDEILTCSSKDGVFDKH
jgi:hypothetical protein